MPTSPTPAATSQPPGRLALFLFLGVLVLSTPQAALLPLLDRDEPRFAEASREMLQGGNYVVPTFNGAPRYAKPPLIYWAQAASFAVLGENAFAARLPSLLATAGTAVLLLFWGTQLGGISVGLIAGVSYAFCLQTMQQGRVATADALLIFFTTLAAFVGWRLFQVARENRYWKGAPSTARWRATGLLLACSFALGFLAKGPEALLPMMPLLILSMGAGAFREGRDFMPRLLAILALALLLVSAWAIPAYLQTNGAYWREGLGHDVGDRMLTSFQGHGSNSLGGYLLSLPFYLFLFWISALPWSPFFALRIRSMFPRIPPDSANGYLLMNAGLYFAVFSLLVTKLPHYTLPAFPFIALFFAHRWKASGLSSAVVLQTTIGFGAAFALLALFLILLAVLPYANPSPTGELVREAGSALTPATEFALVDFQEPNTIWEMRRVVRGYGRTIADNQVSAYLAEPGPRAVLLTTKAWSKVPSAAGNSVSRQVFTAHGWNAAKLSFIDLTLVLNTPAHR